MSPVVYHLFLTSVCACQNDYPLYFTQSSSCPLTSSPPPITQIVTQTMWTRPTCWRWRKARRSASASSPSLLCQLLWAAVLIGWWSGYIDKKYTTASPDWLKYRDGNRNMLLDRTCGNEGKVTEDVISITNKVEVVFHTDSSIAWAGWSLTWGAV